MSDPDSVGAHPSDQIFNWVMTIVSQPIHILVEIVTDPLKSSMELIVIVCLLLFMWMLYWHRDRIIYLLTGDPHLHCDPIDAGASALRVVCGNGEWTRCLTSFPCCYGCCYRQNLIAALGQGLGVSSVPIKLSHIVVGDLPDVGVNSYYLCIECKTDPQMVSSVAEHKLPKIIHFPEIFIIRLRKNILEWHLRISVRRLTAVGHEELCEAFFTWGNILEWCDEEESNNSTSPRGGPLRAEQIYAIVAHLQKCRGQERLSRIESMFGVKKVQLASHFALTPPAAKDPFVSLLPANAGFTGVAGSGAGRTDSNAGKPSPGEKRFQMRPLTAELTEAIPWINLRFSYPHGLDHRADVEQTDPSVQPLIWGDPETIESIDVAHFKTERDLLDPDGRKIYEPTESSINRNYKCKNWPHTCVRISRRLLLLAVVLVSVFRYYSLSCYSSYEAYTKLVHNNNTWRRVGLPISSREIVDVEAYCKVRVDAGYDAHYGEACNPSFQQVNEVCKNPPGDQRPTAFTKAFNRYFDLDVQSPIECPDWVCPFHNSMAVKYDGPLVLGFILMAILLSFFSCCWNYFMRKHLNQRLRTEAEKAEQAEQRAKAELRKKRDEEKGSQQEDSCCSVM